VTAVKFRGDLWHQKTRVPAWAIVLCCLAVLVELRLVIDRQTDTEPWLVPHGRAGILKTDSTVGPSEGPSYRRALVHV